MADKKISQLTALTGALNVADALAIADDSASQTKKINPKVLIEEGVKLIDDGSIPASKIDSTGALPDGAVGTPQLADGSVTAIKLADNSSGLVSAALPAGTRIGQVGVDSTTNKLYVWAGAQWLDVKGAGSVNTVEGQTAGLIDTTVVTTGDTSQIIATHDPTAAAAQFLAGPTGAAGPIEQRVIIGADLPTASPTEKGAVQVNGNGLIVDGDVLKIDNTISPSNGLFHVCDVDANGLVINHRAIEGSDVPTANDSTQGVIRPGVDLAVDNTGALNHINKIDSPGTYTKVTVDLTGHVVNGESLSAADLPADIPIGNLSGQIESDQLAECSITAPKICDYATCLMQEDNPGAGEFLGQFWYTPSTAQLRVYSRGSGPENIWLPVGFGALQANNLRWGGTFDASTDKVGAVTAIGTSEGLTAGSAFPAPSDELAGLYLVCQVEGNNCTQNNIAGLSFDGGDWALCLDGTQGWIIIDANTGGGGGGGGGANYLNDLLDVTIGGTGGPFSTAPQLALTDRQLLKYDGGDGMWKNTDLIDGGSF